MVDSEPSLPHCLAGHGGKKKNPNANDKWWNCSESPEQYLSRADIIQEDWEYFIVPLQTFPASLNHTISEQEEVLEFIWIYTLD